MMLENNKKVHEDVKKQMDFEYKDKLDKLFRTTRTNLWVQQKMPKVKKSPSY